MASLNYNGVKSSDNNIENSEFSEFLISQTNGRTLTFDDAFELTGHGKFNYAVLWSCGLIILSVFMESIGISYVLPAAECDLKLTSSDKGLISSAIFIGMVSSSFLWGYLGDTRGRRGVMLPALLASSLCSLASALATDVRLLVALRILSGVLISASSGIVFVYLGELHTSARRSAAVAWLSVFVSVALIIVPGLAWLIVPMSWRVQLTAQLSLTPWRAFMLTCAMPGLLGFLALLFLPESPKYLQARGHTQQAVQVMRRMYAINKGKSAEDYPVKDIKFEGATSRPLGPAGTPALWVSLWRQSSPLFTSPLLGATSLVYASMFSVFFLSSGLYLWAPDILNQLLNEDMDRSWTACQVVQQRILNASASASNGEGGCRVRTGVFAVSVAMGLVFALVYALIGIIINRVNKRALYMSMMAVCSAATVAASRVPQREAAVALLVLLLCAGCAGSVVAAIAIDVFPTELRAMGMCLIYMVGRTGAVICAHLVGELIDRHCDLAFTTIGVFCLAVTALMVLWPNPVKLKQNLENKGFTF